MKKKLLGIIAVAGFISLANKQVGVDVSVHTAQ